MMFAPLVGTLVIKIIYPKATVIMTPKIVCDGEGERRSDDIKDGILTSASGDAMPEVMTTHDLK